MDFSRLENFFKNDPDGVEVSAIKHTDIEYEERIKLACFYCAQYGKNWHCPPHIPSLDFVSVINEYQNLMLVYKKQYFRADKEQDDTVAEHGGEHLPEYSDARRESSLALHRAMLRAERFCWDNNVSPVATFVAGSCRLCKNGCNKDRCVNPGSARISLEATGMNVIKTAQNAGLSVIHFPPEEYLVRIGLFCW